MGIHKQASNDSTLYMHVRMTAHHVVQAQTYLCVCMLCVALMWAVCVCALCVGASAVFVCVVCVYLWICACQYVCFCVHVCV